MAQRISRAPSVGPRDVTAAFLAAYPKRVQGLVRAACRLVQRTVPTAVPRVYPRWGGIGFRDPQAGYFCGVFPRDDAVQLLFEQGVHLADPDGVFDPPGSRRQVRTITCRTQPSLACPGLPRMLRQAVTFGSTR